MKQKKSVEPTNKFPQISICIILRYEVGKVIQAVTQNSQKNEWEKVENLQCFGCEV